MIKKFALAIATVALLASNASAAQIIGSQAFGGGVTDTTSLNALTSVNLAGFAIGAFDARTGDFVGSPTGVIASASNLSFVVGSSLTGLTTTQFGTFTGTVAFDDNSAVNSRTVYLQGSFTAGTFSTKNDPTTATIILSFTQANGAGNSISVSGTLVTPAISTPGVPEPATVASVFVGLGLLGATRLRRKAAK